MKRECFFAVPKPEKKFHLSDKEFNLTEEDLNKIIKAQILRNKVRDAITVDLVPEQEQVWARHILLEDEETALEVLELLKEGGDFGALAQEHSTGPSGPNGGDLGWFKKEMMVEPFGEVAFSMEIGEISEPVETEFGWHIIQVLGHEMRPLSSEEFEQMKQEYFTTWLQEKREGADIQIFDYWIDRVPTKPEVPVQYRLQP